MPQTPPSLCNSPGATPTTSQSPLTHMDPHIAVPTLLQPSTLHSNAVIATTMSPTPLIEPNPSTAHTVPQPSTSNATSGISAATRQQPSNPHRDPCIAPNMPQPSTTNAIPRIPAPTMPQPPTHPDPRTTPTTRQPPHPNPRVAALQEEIARLEAELGGRDADAIVQEHIRLLHTYNEIKDGTQALIGKYALLTHTTVTAVHRELGLSLVE